MSRKKKKSSPKPKKPAAPPQFGVGDAVRVKAGTQDPDFPDIPMGGWSGIIEEVDARSATVTYLVEWNQRTLENQHPVYLKRCERDGLESGRCWLQEDDIERDEGKPLSIEQPTSIKSRPLQMTDQDDRIRVILGLSSDDPLIDVDGESLAQYHRHLSQRLSFPFPATVSSETGFMRSTTHAVSVIGLLDVEDCDEHYGLICEAKEGRERIEVPLAEVEVKQGDPNRQLIEDYCYWFWNYR